MKRLFLLLGMLVCISMGFSQTRTTFTENFNGGASTFTMSPTSGWKMDTLLSVSGKSAWGYVPNATGDSIELISPKYDLSNYAYAYLRFSHICKISDKDIATVEFKEDYVGAKWTVIPIDEYRGASTVFKKNRCFHHGSYNTWLKNDMMAEPDNSWWKEESFDVSQEVSYATVQFKFKLKRGETVGTNFAFGWLIDNFELTASSVQINPPAVALVSPFTEGLVYGPGPYTIYAKAAKRTMIPLKTPVLRVTYTPKSGVPVKDSILMTSYEGDSIWKAIIPQQLVGTKVTYTVFATDTVGNNASVTSGYTIGREWGMDSNCVAILSIDTPIVGALAGQSNKVYARIQNRGLSNLTSARIDWSINGVSNTPVTWTGNLPEGFTASVYLGSYIPTNSSVDTIEVRVSLPNRDKINNTRDTIVSKSVYSCASYLSGTYNVSPTGTYKTVSEILDLIRICGLSGDVTISLAKGSYAEELDFRDLWNALDNHKLTITSATGKAEDVVIAGTAPTTLRVHFFNSRNIVLTNLTIEGMGGGIYIEDTNDNIEISHCRLLLDTVTTTTYACIAIQKGLPNKIKITDNYLRGTYFGFYSMGESAARKITNVTFTNNVIYAPYYYGTYNYYTDFDYFNNNTVVSRLTDASATFYGIYLYYSDAEEVNNNRVRTGSPISGGRGLYPYYFNQDSSRSGLVANNEIIMNSTGTSYGIYTGYSEAEFYHNTVVMYGNGASRAMYCVNSQAGMDIHFYNNNFVCYNGGYPMYFSTANQFGNEILLDYNNCYGENYLGYIGGNITDLTAWSTKSQDQNAANVNPSFYDYTVSGKCAHYTGLTCPVTRVTRDILDSARKGSTAMGCYTSIPVSFDAVLLRFEDWKNSVVIGQSTPVKVRLMNNSSSTVLTSARIEWMANGVAQTAYNWTGSLAAYKDTVIAIGSYTPKKDNNRIVAWVTQQNNMRSDDNPENDTIRGNAYGCAGPLKGDYTVGKDKDFATIAEAVSILNICGVGGPVTLKLDAGDYSSFSIAAINGASPTNTVTITSASGKAEDVVFSGGSPVIDIVSSPYFHLTHVTVDAFASTYAVRIGGTSTGAQVKYCHIKMNPNTTSGQYGIYCLNDAIRDSVYLIGNRIDGGYYGIYFYGGTGTAANQHGRFNRIDSNVLTNTYYYNIYTYYADFVSVSHNTITDRKENGNATFYGLYSYYCNHHFIVGNKIKTQGGYHSTAYGLYVYYSNYSSYAQNTTDTTYILDNDIYVKASSTTYGFYSYYGNMQVMHNSVYAICSSSGYGMYIYEASPYYCQLRNNNLYVNGGTYYPVYCGGTISYYQISGNNYYHEGNTNLAYMGGARTSLSAVQTYDATATNVLSDYIDPETDGRVCSKAGITTAPVTNIYESPLKNTLL